MILPFVRDLFADAERVPAFTRAASHLKEGTGRITLSGLTPTAKALIFVLLQQAADRGLIVVVPDNRAADELVPVLQGFAELTGALEPDTVVALPARDVLPFQNLSPHPEIQEERAAALWQIASGKASIVVAPVTSTATRLRSPDYYMDLARTVRRADTLDVEALLGHLNVVGYSSADVVEMPGQYALRGGILDVYSPEADRPLRIEFFGDEVESIRKFDPATQRSSTAVDDALPGMRKQSSRRCSLKERQFFPGGSSTPRSPGQIGRCWISCQKLPSWLTNPQPYTGSLIAYGRELAKPTSVVESAIWFVQTIFISLPKSCARS
jgi:transcription-repair coupling factor (superfamily II helicase)